MRHLWVTGSWQSALTLAIRTNRGRPCKSLRQKMWPIGFASKSKFDASNNIQIITTLLLMAVHRNSMNWTMVNNCTVMTRCPLILKTMVLLIKTTLTPSILSPYLPVRPHLIGPYICRARSSTVAQCRIEAP